MIAAGTSSESWFSRLDGERATLAAELDRAEEIDAGARLEVENAVLRDQLSVLRRTVKRPELRRRDRVVLAAASGLLPRERWSVFVVSPQTLLRWQRELVRRKWTYRRRPAGRPPLDPELCARKNSAQDGPARRGAGPKPCCRRSVRIVAAPTRRPSLRNSPWIRTQPQRGFSRANRNTSSRRRTGCWP